MTDALWFMFVGGLLLFMGLTASILKRSLVTSAIIYLAVGVLVGPTVLICFISIRLSNPRCWKS